MNESWGTIVAAVIAAAAAIVSGVYAAVSARRNRREEDEWAARTPEPPTTQQVWERLDELERKYTAIGNVLYTLAEHWPEDQPIPEFDPEDIDILGETLPPRFRKPRRR